MSNFETGAIGGIRGVLIDVDGTLLERGVAVPGAGEALERTAASGAVLRVTTNTTRKPRSAVARSLLDAGLPVPEAWIVTPAMLASRRIVASGRTRVMLLVAEATREDLEGVVEDDEAPDWVVVGDLGPGFTFERLNRAFLAIRSGAALMALHRNRYWITDDGQARLDAGAFVAALELASGIAAETVGKPARAFFEIALSEMGLDPSRVLVVGDDLESDIAGGRDAGCRTALVRTGKAAGCDPPFRPSPDHVIASIGSLRIVPD